MNKNVSWKAIIFSIFIMFLVFGVFSSLLKLFDKNESVKSLYSVAGSSTDARVGVVEIEGVIMRSDEAIKEILEFDKREDIDFIAVRLNTPGGAVAPSQELHDVIKACKKNVLVSMSTVAASGGYYIASSADLIYANRGTITGSIGVISNFADLSELYAFLKLKPWTIKSGKFKDAGTSERAATDEEKAYLQSLIMDLYEQFVKDVAAARNMPVEEVKKVADGRVFTGEKAMEYKLVDKLGGFDAALNAATQKWVPLKKNYFLVYPEKESGFIKFLDSLSEKGQAIADHMKVQTGFYYISREGL